VRSKAKTHTSWVIKPRSIAALIPHPARKYGQKNQGGVYEREKKRPLQEILHPNEAAARNKMVDKV